MNPSEFPVYIVGGGNVGASLAFQLSSHSYPIVAVVQHHPEKHPQLNQLLPGTTITSTLSRASLQLARVIIIAVQDDRLPSVVQAVFDKGVSFANKLVVHTSGVYTSEILAPFRQQGGYAASAHPNIALAQPITSKNPFQDIYFDIEGDDQAFRICRKMLSSLGAKLLRITPNQKVPMHLAAVVYSNFLVVLAEMAQAVLNQSGISDRHLFSPFEPLIASTLHNLQSAVPGEALTGPVMRGDGETIRSHLNFLRKHLPMYLPLYRMLTEQAIRFSGLPSAKKSELRELLQEHHSD